MLEIMKERSFEHGVKPGGLLFDSDIEVLICYMLFSIQGSLKKDDIIEVIQNNQLANYFETTNAFSKLLNNGHIVCDDEKLDTYKNSSTGNIIAEQLRSALPFTVRQTAVNAGMNLLVKAKNEKDNHVSINEVSNGYKVICTINDIDMELMSFSITVSDMLQANTIKDNFLKNPEIFYRNLLALSTGEKSFLR